MEFFASSFSYDLHAAMELILNQSNLLEDDDDDNDSDRENESPNENSPVNS